MDDKPIRSDDKELSDETPIEGPENWDRHQMETDDQGEEPGRDPESVPAWNKDEMGEERPDGTRGPLTPPDELDEPGGGLSGHGSNPGGGERWAERDRQK